MTLTLPTIRVGEPIRHESLSVFPLFTESSLVAEYVLADDALTGESLLVEEVDEGGSVPDLLVENSGDVRVLFLEGEELIGAKQNRVLNTSVLVAAHTKIKIPVSCVEQGRWRYRSRYFGSSGSHSPAKLRRALKASVSKSLQEQQGHRSDQGKVWQEVGALNQGHGVRSSTDAMSDAFEMYADQIADYRKKLGYVQGACGMAVAVGGRVESLDLFDKPATCEKVWERMLSGVVFDALEAGATSQFASVADVEKLLATADELAWSQSEAVGEGQEYRAESERGDHASALAILDTVVHGSLVAVE